MRVIAVIAVSITILGTCLADEDDKLGSLDYYKCISCHEKETVLDRYMNCTLLRPDKHQKIVEDCKVKFDVHELKLRDFWGKICKNEEEFTEKMYECVMEEQKKIELDNEESTKVKDFLKCAMDIEECSENF